MNIVTIGHGDYQAKINLSRGANCISLRNTKYDVCVLREPDYTTELDNPYLYGMPVLFPVNRILNGTFEFEGRDYTFPINEPPTNCHLHGFLHQVEFSLLEQGEEFVKCLYESDETYAFFPHQFRVEMTYSLSDAGLRQEVCIHNLSETNMPSFLGFHTTFNVPFSKGSKGCDCRVFSEVGEEIEREMKCYLPTGNRLRDTDLAKRFLDGTFVPVGEPISKHYKAINQGKIELRDLNKGFKISYQNDEKYGWRLFYNGEAEEYICLEPQTCMVNCQNLKENRLDAGFDFIQPKACKTYYSQICVEEMEV